MATRLPRLSRSGRGDHYGTYRIIIGARYTVKTISVVVCVVWDSSTTATVGPKPKDNG